MSKFKSTGKRILAIMLSGALLFTGYPVNISAAETDNVDEDNLVEEQLKQQLMEGADEHPNGLFGFYETQLGGTEGDTLQINVVRQGGTKGEASVEFKAVDITSAYGKDYVISVPDATGEMIELEANPKAAPLVELYGNALTTSDNEAAEATPEAAATKVPSQGTKSTSALSKLVQADEVEGQSNWRELNSEDENYQKVEEMMNSREESTKDELAKLEGVTATLKFAEGEYKKVINVKLLDDEASESDEQMMFSLLNAASAEIGENYNGYVNILDNDDVEVASFEMAESEVSVQGKDSVDITIKRTSAINQLSVVSVGTSAKTAQAGTDYTSVKQDLVFAPGMKEKSITIPIVNTYPDSAVSFYVGLDDSSARVNSMKNATLVTIEKAEMKETAETDDKAESKSWSDKGDINKTISTDNGYQTLNSQTFDLRLASEVKITFVSTEGSTSYRDWFLGKKKYHRDRCVAFKLTQSDLSTQYSWCKTQSSFDEQTISIDVSGNNMSKAALKGRVYGANSNTYAKLTIKKYEIVYPGYTIVMNNSFNTAGFANNGYKPRLYTARNEFTQEDNYIQFGKAYCYRDGVKAANTQTTVYRFGDGLWYYWEYADNVTENSKIKISSQNVEFKGFQLQKANAVNEWSETIPLDKMDAYTLSTRKDYIFNNNVINVRPVFKPVETTIHFNNNSISDRMSGSFKGFYNDSKIQVTALDTIQVTGVPNAGKAIASISVYGSKSKTATAKLLETGRKDVARFVADKDYEVSNCYEPASLKVAPDPLGRNWLRGNILYYDAQKSKNSMSTAENTKGTITINDVSINSLYRLTAVARDDKYKAEWRDGTLDTSPEDGTISEVEKNAMPSYIGFAPIKGNVLEYMTYLPTSKLYYNFYIPSDSYVNASIQGKVKVKDKVLFSGETSVKGINGVTVTSSGVDSQLTKYNASSKKVLGGDGYFELEGEDFSPGDSYLVNFSYTGSHGSSLVASQVMHPAIAETITLNPEDDIYVTGAKVYQVTTVSGKDNLTEIAPSALVTGTKSSQKKYRIRVKANSKNTSIQPVTAILRFYNNEGVEFTDKAITKYINVGDNGNFEIDFVPYALGLTAGTTMTLQFVDQMNKSHYEYQTGLMLGESVGILDFANSFQIGGVNKAIQLFGTIDSVFDMGWNGDFDDAANGVTKTDTDANGRVSKTIMVGIDKTILDNKKFDTSSVGKSATKAAEASRDYTKLKDELTKKGKATKDQLEELKDLKKDADDKQKDFDEKMGKASDNKKISTSITTSVSVAISFSFTMRFLQYNDKDAAQDSKKDAAHAEDYTKKIGSYYFDAMTISAKVSGGVGMNVAFAVPIGITINLGFGVEGDPDEGLGSATYVIEQRSDSDNVKKYFISDLKSSNDKIDIFNNDLSSTDRAFDGSGSFGLNPKIYLNAGVGVLGNLVRVYVGGGAQFNMSFYTTATENTGSVTLDAVIGVNVLGVRKEWPFASKSYSLYGGSASSIEEENYLYESADLMTAYERENLKNRSEWNPDELSAESIDENTANITACDLMQGVYAHPDTQIMKINDEGDYLAIFLDDDTRRLSSLNSAALYYTIFSNETATWSFPRQIENDGTLDQGAKLFDLKDRGIAIVWSSASKVFDDNTSKVDMLNSMDLHACFFNKQNRNINSEVMNITKETAADDVYGDAVGFDNVADVEPNLVYDDTSGQLVAYYTKNEYSVSDESEGEVIGDVVHPSLSLMAYRTYSFEERTWVDTYNATNENEIKDTLKDNLTGSQTLNEAYKEYEKAWYGQSFINTAPAVYIQEELTEEGYWKDNTKPVIYPYYNVVSSGDTTDTDAGVVSGDTVVSGSDTGTVKVPKIIDSDAISYNGLGLFAYTVDYDQDLKTINDRDIFLQIFDFETQVFTHPIMVTSDNVNDSSPKLSRVELSQDGKDYSYTTLNYLSDGNIVSLDVSNVVQNCLTKKTTDDGVQYYIINKSSPSEESDELSYIPPVTMVTGEKAEDNDNAQSAITGFDVKQNNGNVYYMWTQSEYTAEDDTHEASLETQIYAKRYNVKDDEMGLPVQVTSQEDTNYDNLAFEVLNNGSILALATQAGVVTKTAEDFNAEVAAHNEQVSANDEIEEVSEDTFVPYKEVDTNKNKFVSMIIDPVSVLKLKTNEEQELVAGELNPIDVTLHNDGLDNLSNITVKVTDADDKSILYDIVSNDQGEEEVKAVDKITIDKLLSGDSYNAIVKQTLAADEKETIIHVLVTDKNGKKLLDKFQDYHIESKLHIEDYLIEQTDTRNRFVMKATVVNDSNCISDAASVKVTCGDDEITSIYVPAIEQGGTYSIVKPFTVDSTRVFKETTDTDGSVTATAEFVAAIGNRTATETVTRAASDSEMTAMKAITNAMIGDGKAVSLTEGEIKAMETNIQSSLADEDTGITGTEGLKVRYEVEDENVALVDEAGHLSGISEGETRIKAYVMPRNSSGTVTVENNGTTDAESIPVADYEDNYYSLPDSAIKVYKTAIKVIKEAIEPTQTPVVTKPPVPEKTATPAPADTPTPTPADTPTPTPTDSPSPAPKITSTPTPAPEKTQVPASTQTPTITPSQVPVATTVPNDDGSKVTVGTSVKVGKASYKVTSVKKRQAECVSVKLGKKTSYVIPASVKIKGKTYKVTSIAKNVFKSNKKLKKITVGAKVTNIKTKAFYGCTSLKQIIFKGKKSPVIGKKAFSRISAKAQFVVPKKSYNNYKKKLTKKTGFLAKMKLKKK